MTIKNSRTGTAPLVLEVDTCILQLLLLYSKTQLMAQLGEKKKRKCN